MKIVVVGPMAPYRGGIAHHNNLLIRALRRRGHGVDGITFSRQYPEFLYPGAFQEEEGEEFSEIRAERSIDSMNPFSWRRIGRAIAEEEYDLVLTRFWIPMFGPMYASLQRKAGGGRPNGRIITIVDNLLPHEPRPGDRIFTDRQFRYCNGAITQSGTVSRQFRDRFPAIPETMIPHPVYEHFGEELERVEARRIVGETGEHPLLLFFGFVRKYKGLDLLLEAMPAILDRVPAARLLVVGEYFEDREQYQQIISRLGIGDAVRTVDRYVPNEEVATWFSAADLLVLPYRSATNSGIVQIGYNFAVPSVVTNVGSLAEVVVDEKTGYVIEQAGPEEIAVAVAKGLDPATNRRLSANIVEERKKYSWAAFAENVERFAEDLFGEQGVGSGVQEE